jgi:hypothetical protein
MGDFWENHNWAIFPDLSGVFELSWGDGSQHISIMARSYRTEQPTQQPLLLVCN